MSLKHKVQINITSVKGDKQMVVKSGVRKLPKRIMKFLFGEDAEILVMKTGGSVGSVEIKELGGIENE
jgi:hypothetical protein